MKNPIKPEHYKTAGKLYWKLRQAIDIIDCAYIFSLPADIMNVWKYTYRAGKKAPETEIEDLQKAKNYIERRIEFLKSQRHTEGDGSLP